MHRVIGGPLWCARRWDDTGPVLYAGSPDELAGAIGREDAQRGGSLQRQVQRRLQRECIAGRSAR